MEGLVLTNSIEPQFWSGRRVLVTGHTGFKGAWLTLLLLRLGAEVHGVALEPGRPALFSIAGVERRMAHRIGDLRDPDAAGSAVAAARPEIVFHLAAEALVRRSFADPVRAFSTNVMGTVNLLEALRRQSRPEAIVVATSDKVYRTGGLRPHDEDTALEGNEPYSASKVAQEMAALAYGRSYFEPAGVPLATARAGNVIGGGDFGEDRLIPDLVRAAETGRAAILRHPLSVRPWQYVLDCLSGYLLYAQRLALGDALPRALNFGPAKQGMSVQEIASRFERALERPNLWKAGNGGGPHEEPRLTISARRARALLGWKDHLPGAQGLNATANWYACYLAGADMTETTLAALEKYLDTTGKRV